MSSYPPFSPSRLRLLENPLVLLATLACLTGCSRVPDALAPDEVFHNGKVITVDEGFSIALAFAVRNGEFVAVGDDDDVLALAGEGTRRTDLEGRTVVPGLMDNHNHQFNAALVEYRGVDLHGVTSLEEMFARIRAHLETAPAGEPVITTGGWAIEDLEERRAPTRAELDRVAPDGPLVVIRLRGTAYLNSAALRAAGIGRGTGMIGGVEILKDASGEPTGAISTPGVVNRVVARVVPYPPLRELEQLLARMQERQLALGLTSIRELELPPVAMRAYQELRRHGGLKMRVSMGYDVLATEWVRVEEMEEMESWLAGLGVEPGFGDHWLRMDSLAELPADGTPANALMREPRLSPAGERGAMRVTAEQIREGILAIHRHGWRPALHLMGNATLDHVLDAFEAADAVEPIRERRWVVEHIPFVQPDQIERLARLGVLVSAQYQPYQSAERNREMFGEEMAERALPVREMLEAGVVVSSGSDWPGEDSNPFLPIEFYVTRRTEHGGVTGPGQAVSREQALRMATINNAYMTFEEDVKGSIEPGKLADFVILSGDYLTVPDEAIRELRPVATYVGGERVYSAAPASR